MFCCIHALHSFIVSLTKFCTTHQQDTTEVCGSWPREKVGTGGRDVLKRALHTQFTVPKYNTHTHTPLYTYLDNSQNDRNGTRNFALLVTSDLMDTIHYIPLALAPLRRSVNTLTEGRIPCSQQRNIVLGSVRKMCCAARNSCVILGEKVHKSHTAIVCTALELLNMAPG